MSLTYAVADIHGRLDLLEAAIGAIEAKNAEAGSPGGTVVFLGDYIDRGPDSHQVIDLLMRGPEGSSLEWVVLAGNHEAMMVTCLADRDKAHWWFLNGGIETMRSYGAKFMEDLGIALDRVPMEHIDWINSLPLYHVDQHRVFVHAGVDHDKPINQNDEKTLQWLIFGKGDERDHFGRHIVHGHHQHGNGPILYKGRTNLDTGAFYTDRLVVGVFDDDVPGGPVSLLEVIRHSV